MKLFKSFVWLINRPVTRGKGGEAPPRKIFAHLEKCVGYSLKTVDKFKKFGPLSENSSTLLVSQAGYGPAHKRLTNLAMISFESDTAETLEMTELVNTFPSFKIRNKF